MEHYNKSNDQRLIRKLSDIDERKALQGRKYASV